MWQGFTDFATDVIADFCLQIFSEWPNTLSASPHHAKPKSMNREPFEISSLLSDSGKEFD
jgi:hypothetical protein